MLKRTSSIKAKDDSQELEVFIFYKQKTYSSNNASSEASATLRKIEDEIAQAVFSHRFYLRNIQFSGEPD
jgi:hypothetical protein